MENCTDKATQYALENVGDPDKNPHLKHKFNKVKDAFIDACEWMKQKDQTLLDFVLEIDFMTTKEFCTKHGIAVPVASPDVTTNVMQFLQIDAIKHRMFVEKAKETIRKKNDQAA